MPGARMADVGRFNSSRRNTDLQRSNGMIKPRWINANANANALAVSEVVSCYIHCNKDIITTLGASAIGGIVSSWSRWLRSDRRCLALVVLCAIYVQHFQEGRSIDRRLIPANQLWLLTDSLDDVWCCFLSKRFVFTRSIGRQLTDAHNLWNNVVLRPFVSTVHTYRVCKRVIIVCYFLFASYSGFIFQWLRTTSVICTNESQYYY